MRQSLGVALVLCSDFYTSKSERLTNIVSRFQVRKDDPNQADPGCEVEILRFKKPYWNHDGGTIIFGRIDPIWEYYHHDTGKSIIDGVFNHYMPGVSIQIGRETETGLRHSWKCTS